MARTTSALRTGVAPAAVAAILLGATAPACADDDALVAPPPGFQLGPVFVTPSLATGLDVDSNPFNQSSDKRCDGVGKICQRDSDCTAGEACTDPPSTGDLIAVANPMVTATLPFHRSWFRASYDGVFRNYDNSQTASNNSSEVKGELALRFASFDQLSFGYNRQRGAADTIRFDGGEAIYNGTPYTFSTYEVAAQRQVAGHFGYGAVVRYNKLSFDSTDYAFFEYDGFEGAFEGRAAISPNQWLVFGGGFRRYDHRLANDPTVVYRQEVADAVQAGVQGFGARSQSWRVVLRYDWANYPGGTGSNYSGLGGEATLILQPGPTSSISLYASRRNWASFYEENNYYLANVVGVRGEKRFPSGSAIGFDTSLGLTDYPDVVHDPIIDEDIKRHDVGSRAEFYASFVFRSACALRLSFLHQGRSSNAGGVNYRGDSLGLSFVLGWR